MDELTEKPPLRLDELPASYTIELLNPIVFGGGTWTEITLREPMVEERQQAEQHLRNGNMPHAQSLYQMALIAKVSGVPMPVVQRMPVRKVNEAMFYLSGFLFGGLPTGEI